MLNLSYGRKGRIKSRKNKVLIIAKEDWAVKLDEKMFLPVYLVEWLWKDQGIVNLVIQDPGSELSELTKTGLRVISI